MSGRAIVVFYRVARAKNLGPLQPSDGADKRQLGLVRERGGYAVNIVFSGVTTLWLKKDLMPFLVRELDDLVFDGWAVTGTNSFDCT